MFGASSELASVMEFGFYLRLRNILTNYGRSARIPQNTVNHHKIDNGLGLVVKVRVRVMVRVRIRVRVYG